MNPAEKRKQVVQVIVLVVLLGVLGASMFYMIRNASGQGVKKPTAQVGEAAAESSAIAMNPNLFRVYSLDPPKNPFVQQERWYEDKLAEYPGYPYLRDQGFFETMDPVVPEIEGLLSEGDEWYGASLQRKETDKRWVIEGRSEDEMIKTSLTLDGPPAEEFDVAWNRSSGMPFSALKDPSWVEGYQLAGGLPDSGDLFQSPTAGGLPVPGGAGGSVLTGGMPQGDMLLCHGVSVQGDRMSALISFNGIPRMVSPGDSLPPRYQVETITADGVVLTEIKNCETRWVPLSNPSAYAGQANSAQLPTATPPLTST